MQYFEDYFGIQKKGSKTRLRLSLNTFLHNLNGIQNYF